MKVLKFGGSSVRDSNRIRAVAEILKPLHQSRERFAVVVSALGGITDNLVLMANLAEKSDSNFLKQLTTFSERHISVAQELLESSFLDTVIPELENNHRVLENLLQGIFLVREASPRTMDYVLSFGERNSAFLISEFLRQEGIPTEYLDARKVIRTDKRFGAARVKIEETYQLIQDHFAAASQIQLMTGFIGSSKGGLTTTLGRGGSDYSASLLAAALGAQVLEIWTDVNGVLTADPRRVKKAFTLPSLTYAEAVELSYLGAKVIYPPTIRPVREKNIPVRIRNTFNPAFLGTLISNTPEKRPQAVTGISSINSIALITLQGTGLVGVPGMAARLFSSLARLQINIMLITQGSSEQSITFAILPEQVEEAFQAVSEEFSLEIGKGSIDPIRVERSLSVVGAIGEHMRSRPGISGRLFQALGKNGINVVAIAQGSSERNISVVVDQGDEAKALNALHEAFFLSDVKQLHLFFVGVGLIGGTLIRQILRQSGFLREKMATEIRIVGLSNSRKMLFQEEGIALEKWNEKLENEGEEMDFNRFIQRMKDLNLPNSIFVDNTADRNLASHYQEILDASISISTPNKTATSSSYQQYQSLKKQAWKRGVQFLYETNVGAGLPVLSTLHDLMVSGDRILQIEGVLSGSMSFIFNSLDNNTPLSEAIREAARKGLTEPDPREDLSGNDVRRKLVILARESRMELEMNQIKMEEFLPTACFEASTVEVFFEELEKWEHNFTARLEEVHQNGKRLRFLAVLNRAERKAEVRLAEVGPGSPFFGLSGSDNMIVFTTDRYLERPLVVRGPGAGAEVTAAGVFAEILKIGNHLS